MENTPNTIQFAKLQNLKDLKIVIWSDASYANFPNENNQREQIVFLGDGKMTACLLTWKSTKIQIVVKSMLAAETLSFVEGVTCHYFWPK